MKKMLSCVFLLITILFYKNIFAQEDNHTRVIAAIGGYTIDNIIETRLNLTYNLNNVLSKYNIKVDSADGIVELTGAVSNNEEKNLAEKIAKMTQDVKEVNNRLVVDKNVKTGGEYSGWAQSIFDATITTSVKSNLLLNPQTSALKIKVNTVNNIVTLTGKVSSPLERRIAGEIAIKTQDVKAVKNFLELEKR